MGIAKGSPKDQRNSYILPCECGDAITVVASDAGEQSPCRCGRDIAVPPLSRLRTLNGEGAYESSALDRIRSMLAMGSLPAGHNCAISNQPTESCIEFEVICDPLDPPAGPSPFLVMASLLLTGGRMIIWRIPERKRSQEEWDALERIRIPLLVSPKYHKRIKRRAKDQDYLRELLAIVPVYARLVREYPGARVVPVV